MAVRLGHFPAAGFRFLYKDCALPGLPYAAAGSNHPLDPSASLRRGDERFGLDDLAPGPHRRSSVSAMRMEYPETFHHKGHEGTRKKRLRPILGDTSCPLWFRVCAVDLTTVQLPGSLRLREFVFTQLFSGEGPGSPRRAPTPGEWKPRAC